MRLGPGGPRPESRIGLPMEPEQLPTVGRRSPDPSGQRFGLHAVLDAQDACLEQLPLGPVRPLGPVARYPAGLLAEREVGVSGSVGFHHRLIAG